MLSAPPAFVVLAIIVLTLSAYLRQLSETRRQLIEDIEFQREDARLRYPLGQNHAKTKLKHLKGSQQISMASLI
jgi:hypothetical protein